MIDLSPQATTLLVTATGVLLVLLGVLMVSRARIFTQYLRHMTGISLSPRDVARVYAIRGQEGVRDLFLDLIIRQDLAERPQITPDSSPDLTALAQPERR